MSNLTDGNIKAVLFDLDGTLVDTAPDMVGVLQDLQRSHGLEPIGYEIGRSHVSRGAIGLLRLAFPDTQIDPNGQMLTDYIERYTSRVCDQSKLFDGMDRLLQQLESGGVSWGVVTNKPGHLTAVLIQQLGLDHRSNCIVSGDTLDKRKPDPEPLLYACELTGTRPQDTVYIGDADRDIEAGRRAGVATIVAAYGYITAEDDPSNWGADVVAADMTELAKIVLKAVNLDS